MGNRRVFLKLSGEALSLPNGGYDTEKILCIAKEVKEAVDKGAEVGITIGGGNYWRGRDAVGIDRTKADSIGMLATVMNCIYASEVFRSIDLGTDVFTPFICGTITKQFSKDEANKSFKEGKVLFFGGGTGHPYFSTDTGLILKAIEMNADIVLMAKNIDGVYDKDPAKYKDAKKYDTISLSEIINNKLGVIDLTASVMAFDNKMPIAIFDLNEKGAITAALNGDVHGTVITAE